MPHSFRRALGLLESMGVGVAKKAWRNEVVREFLPRAVHAAAAVSSRVEAWLGLSRRVPPSVVAGAWAMTVSTVIGLTLGGVLVALAKPYGFGLGERAAYRVNDYLDLRRDGDAGPFLGPGWSPAGETGRRTVGNLADIVFPSSVTHQRRLTFVIFNRPFFAPGESDFWVDVLINGRMVARRQYDRDNQSLRMTDAPFLIEHVDAPNKPMHVTLVIGTDGAARRVPGSGLEIESMVLQD